MPFSRNIDFFGLDTGGLKFEKKMSDLFEERERDKKKGVLQLKDPSAFIYLRRFDKGKGFCEGMIVRLRTEDIPMLGDYVIIIIIAYTICKGYHGY